MYDPSDALLPTDGFDANAAFPPQFQQAFSKFGGRVPPTVDAEKPAALQALLTTIRALVRHIDDAIGTILRHIDLTRSLVFFTSDHGDYAGHRGVLKKAPWIPFDDLARVPFFVAGNGVAGGRRLTNLVQSSDFVPTALDYAGVDFGNYDFDARSLRALLSDPTRVPDGERAVFSATTMGWPMVRRRQFKYIWHRGTWSNVLFDLAEDPHETTTLHEDPEYRSEREQLSKLLDEALQRPVPDLRSADDRDPNTFDPR